MMKKWLVLLGLTCWGLTSCQPVPISPTSTIAVVASTNTPQPTNTFLPTSTLTPTSTSVPPTPTIIPPDVLTRYLENVHIVKTDTFDESSGWNSNAEISSGELKVVGKGGRDWNGASYNTTFQEGDGIVVNFKFTQGSYFGMYFENGAWGTAPYKRFGIDIKRGTAESNLFIGKDSLGFTSVPGNLSPRAETWYSLFLVSGKGGDFFALIWDPSNPEKTIRYKDKVKNWEGLDWKFITQINEGTIIFDNFAEIEFDSIK